MAAAPIIPIRQVLTNSRLKAFRACPRLHQYSYELGYRPAEDAEPLRFGSLVHLGLEAWWRAAKDGADQDARFHAALKAIASPEYPYDQAKAAAMLLGYTVRWGLDEYEILEIEVEFECQVRNPVTGASSRTWSQGGKIDAIVRDRQGRVLIVEHKTSGEDIQPGSNYWQRLRMDSQISTYYEGARALGYDVWGCLYDVLGKPGQRPLKAGTKRHEDETPEEYGVRVGNVIAEAPNDYFQRSEIVRLDDEMREHHVDVWLTAGMMRKTALAGVAPRNPDACQRYGRTCDFFPVCSGQASLDDPSLYRRTQSVNEELSGGGLNGR